MGNKHSTSTSGQPSTNVWALKEQRPRKNEEDISVVWFDDRDNTESDDNKLFRQQTLRQINDYVAFFNNKDEFLAYIQSIQDEHVFLTLVPTTNTDDLLSAIHSLNKISCIFLYSDQIEDQEPFTSELIEKYSKIVGKYETRSDLIVALQKKIELYRRQIAMFSFYDDRKQKTAHDLSKESGSFIFFQLFQYITMTQTKSSEESKQEMLAKCRIYYQNNRKQLEAVDVFEQTYQQTDAILWYTKNSFIYRLINKALRTEDIDTLLTFQFYITDLSRSLQQKFQEMKRSEALVPSTFTVYRGLNLPEHEVDSLKRSVGQLISTNGYLSTSRLRQVAVMFANKVMMEIEMDMRLKNVICADIAHMSTFDDEEEVLFDIGAVFEIISYEEQFDDDSNTSKMLIFKMKATDKGSELAREYIDYQKKRVYQADLSLIIGCLLIDMGQNDKSKRYFERLLVKKPNDEKVACICSSLARAYRLDGHYDKSIEYYERAYKLHINIRPQRFLSAARVLNGIGLVYGQQCNYTMALEKLMSSLKLYKKYGKEDEEYAGILNNLAGIHCSLQELDVAKGYFKKVEQINEKLLPIDHPNRATVLINIGNIHYQKKNYTKSLVYYLKAMDMKDKVLPLEHPDKICCLDNIGLVHLQMGNDEQARQYFQKALSIAEKVLLPHSTHSLVNQLHKHIELVKNEIPDVSEAEKPSALKPKPQLETLVDEQYSNNRMEQREEDQATSTKNLNKEMTLESSKINSPYEDTSPLKRSLKNIT
ncbi:unnamed protein product [Didymodactylos carnosus]|uniref:ADP ribosyltransferase domain-containing protein n=1 Tax=Didymodactylos carnosus TaxID=1234261 RepID=A0A814UAS9_9BILA|nr:unnamed protein product [Didymodactylos carnosus]CAF3937182.1 unnamed protein product [Didymodactylos carnosus]